MSDLHQYDHMDPVDAIIAVWRRAAPGRVGWQIAAQSEVRSSMPLLVRAIERLVADARLAAATPPARHGRA